jgi:hypothetical protein
LGCAVYLSRGCLFWCRTCSRFQCGVQTRKLSHGVIFRKTRESTHKTKN